MSIPTAPKNLRIVVSTPQLDKPTNLNAVGIGNAKIQLTWIDNANGESGYELQSRWGTEPFTSIPTLPANSIGYTHTDCPPGRIYYYRVRSLGSGETSSPWSIEVSAMSDQTNPTPTPPPVPTPTPTPNPTSRWTAQRATAWMQSRPWVKGFNFVPSTAGNTTEIWQTPAPGIVGFDPVTIDKELALGQSLGYNSIRLFIQYVVWRDNPALLKERFAQVLSIAASHNISVMPVLFDDCAFGSPPQRDPFMGRQRDPIPGMVLSNWTPSPGVTIGNNSAEYVNLRAYVQDMLKSFANDTRIIAWDLFNEPGQPEGATGSPMFLQLAFSWAREVNPSQPLTVGPFVDHMGGIAQDIYAMSDIITFHQYSDTSTVAGTIDAIRALPINIGYPIASSEWFARLAGGDLATGLPMFKSKNAGCYMWGFVNGRAQAHFPWWNKPGDPVAPQGWFHDIFYPDYTPYRPEEIDAIRATQP